MRLLLLMGLSLLISSCDVGDHNRRAYVISQSHLDAESELPAQPDVDP